MTEFAMTKRDFMFTRKEHIIPEVIKIQLVSYHQSTHEIEQCNAAHFCSGKQTATTRCQDEFSAKLRRTSKDLRDSSLKVAYSNSVIWPAIGGLGAIGLVLVAWQGGKMVIRDQVSLGTLSAAILYILRLQFPLIGLGWVASMIQRANVSIDRLATLRKSFVVEPNSVRPEDDR